MEIKFNIADEYIEKAAKGIGYKARVKNPENPTGPEVDNPLSQGEFVQAFFKQQAKNLILRGLTPEVQAAAQSAVT